MTERQATQSGKLKDAAREAERDEDEVRSTERLKKVANEAPSQAPSE